MPLLLWHVPLLAASAAHNCWSQQSAEDQRQAVCKDFCAAAPQYHTWSRRGCKYCDWCECSKGSCCPGGVDFKAKTAGLSPAAFDEARQRISSAVVAGSPVPLAAIMEVFNTVSVAVENALTDNLQWPIEKVHLFFKRFGDISTEPAQVIAYARALGPCAVAPPKHICEVGFFAGMSATLFLTLSMGQKASYTAIDFLNNPFSYHMVKWVTNMFPGRAEIIKGNSLDLLSGAKPPPAALSECDLWSLDGSHRPLQVAQDVMSALRVSPHTAMVLVDDLTSSKSHLRVPEVSRNYIKNGGITNTSCVTAALAWDRVKLEQAEGTRLTTSHCTVSGRKYGTPDWCSAWCIATIRNKQVASI